jgi:hypothetical protein
MADDSQMPTSTEIGPVPVRYVVLHHTGVVPEHFDLMFLLPEGKALVTLQVLEPPELWKHTPPKAERLPDHRLAYLTYEGPISGGRGQVRRVLEGEGVYYADARHQWRISLSGNASGEIAVPIKNLRDLLTRPGSDWQFGEAPLKPEQIATLLKRMTFPLPPSLIALYDLCNGGEGPLPFDPWTFVLWNLNAIADLREHPHYREFYGQLLFFGGNGAGAYFGFNSSGNVFYMDPIAGEKSAIVVADSFDEFAVKIGFRVPLRDRD